MSIPVIDSTSDLRQHQFDNRYAIYCHDPFDYQPVSNELIEQLAIELKAINPVIVITEMASGRDGKYLTADSFDTLQDEINQKEEKDCLAGDSSVYLLEIWNKAFYKGYPKQFWVGCDTDRFIKAFNEYGEVSYQQPITVFSMPVTSLSL